MSAREKIQAEIPVPTVGVNMAYDTATSAVNAVKAELETYLEQYVKLYKDRNVRFANAKFRFEVEIPEEHVKNDKPREFELTS